MSGHRVACSAGECQADPDQGRQFGLAARRTPRRRTAASRRSRHGRPRRSDQFPVPAVVAAKRRRDDRDAIAARGATRTEPVRLRPGSASDPAPGTRNGAARSAVLAEPIDRRPVRRLTGREVLMIDRRLRSTASRSVLPSDKRASCRQAVRPNRSDLAEAHQQKTEHRQGHEDFQQGEARGASPHPSADLLGLQAHLPFRARRPSSRPRR